MKEKIKKMLAIVWYITVGVLTALGGISLFLLIGALLSGSFSGNLIPIF